MQSLNFKHSKFSLSRSFLSYSKIQLLISAILRNNPLQLTGKIFLNKYVNCGCGPNFRRNFVNIDWIWMPGIDICWDVTRKLPFGDESIKGLYTEHMLEHLSFEKACFLLAEFKRILQKGAVLRIVVPDAELYLDLYQTRKQGLNRPFPYETDSDETPMMHVNRIFRGHGHLFAYDFQTLQFLLSKAGFKSVQRETFLSGKDPILLIDSEGRKIESLYVEAIV